MIIDTDIKAISEDGIQERIRCYSPDELLNVMKLEHIMSCNIAVDTMGVNVLKTKVSQSDVASWIEENER